MKTRNIILPLTLSIVLTVFLVILKQYTAATIAGLFSLIMLVTLCVIIFIDLKHKKRLDKRFGVYTKENLMVEYDKHIRLKDNDKFKAVCMLYIQPIGTYTNEDIKGFSALLRKKFTIDPIGYDEGIVVILGNIHELMLDEMLRQIDREIKEQKAPINYQYGVEYYTGNEDYETLMNTIRKGLK